MGSDWSMAGERAHGLPDPVLQYIVEAQPIQDALRRALIHLAGFALERITGAGSLVAGYGLVEAARLKAKEVDERLGLLVAPPSAAHHRLHLTGAAAALASGTAAALSKTDPENERLMHALELANSHLRAAGRCLPGAANVDFTQSCCAGPALESSGHTTGRPTEKLNGRRHGQLFDLGAGLCGRSEISAERHALWAAVPGNT